MLRECFSAITKVIFHKNDEVNIAFYGNLQSFRALVRRFPSNVHVYSLSYWPELRYRQGLRQEPKPESRPLLLPELGSGLWPIPESELRPKLRPRPRREPRSELGGRNRIRDDQIVLEKISRLPFCHYPPENSCFWWTDKWTNRPMEISTILKLQGRLIQGLECDL